MSGDPFGRSQLPAHLTREGRVRLLGEAAGALVAGKELSREQALFLGGALAAWIENGGDLERDYLRVAATAGSHRTPASIWRALKKETGSSRGEQRFEEGAMLATSSTNPEGEKA